MKYYKIISNSTIVGVCTSEDCYRFQPKHSRIERTNDENVEYLEYKNHLYHALWMKPLQTNIYTYEIATISLIEEQEYNILAPISEPIPIDESEDTPEEPIIEPVDPIEEITIDYVKQTKLTEMSRTCRITIESGIDMEIRGETKHFSLSAQDQINLMNFSLTAQADDLIPYHADGEECTFYTAEEIKQIAAAANTFKIYHTTYYNALKNYINALDTIEDIAAITYGTPIPEEYKTEVLKTLE